LSSELPPLDEVAVLGVGHSLGGCLVVVEQSEFRSYDAICVLGFTHGRKDRLVGPGATDGDPATARQLALEQAKARLGDTWDDVYSGRGREHQHEWLHGSDVPDAVMAADDALAVRWPRMATVDAVTAGLSASYAERVDTATFLGFGEHDIPEHPHDEVSFYPRSRDVTLVVLPRSAHCHNFASTRHLLWDRIGAWAE
jgi:hypothetical protein